MKMRTAARAIAVAAVAGLGLALTGCGASSGDYDGPKVTISFWNGWTGGAAPVLVPKLIEKFNAEHENIVVKDVPMEWADIAKKMPLAVKAGKGPDVSVPRLQGERLPGRVDESRRLRRRPVRRAVERHPARPLRQTRTS